MNTDRRTTTTSTSGSVVVVNRIPSCTDDANTFRTNFDSRPRTMTIINENTYGSCDRENPFVEGGELSRKANIIIEKSVISSTQVRIHDPDTAENRLTQEEVKIVQSPIIAVQAATSNEATPTTAQTTPTSGEAATDEVLRVQPEREQNAKRVKLKKKGCKCSIQ